MSYALKNVIVMLQNKLDSVKYTVYYNIIMLGFIKMVYSHPVENRWQHYSVHRTCIVLKGIYFKTYEVKVSAIIYFNPWNVFF